MLYSKLIGSMRRLLLSFILFLLIQPPATANIHFLTISDIHYGSNNKPGDGQDTGKQLLKSALKKFNQLTEQADFIITLGDFPTHGLFGSSSEKKKDIQAVFQGLYQEDVKAAKPMFYVTGNNDTHGNYQPFSWHGESPLSLATNWQGACIHCKGLLIDQTHLFSDGYYSTYISPNHKNVLLIVLNSIQFTNTPLLLPAYPNQDRDARQQLDWLAKQLKTHHATQLLIAMHIPPGTDYKGNAIWHTQYLKQFIHLLSANHHHYQQISLLTAHTHMDDIRKIQLEDGTHIYAYATPAISRIHHNNPAMKVFELDSTMKLKNYTTYYTTMDLPWKNEHYLAINGTDSLFPQCHGRNLASCLDSMSNESICQHFKQGLFYGAKSPRVDNSACQLTYPVRSIF